MGLYDDLNNRYKIQKTLRFELKPIGKTKENINNNKIIKDDNQLSEDYVKLKEIINEYHKDFIDDKLTNAKIGDLNEYYNAYINKSDNRVIEDIKAKLRKEVAGLFSKDKDEFKRLFGKELIKEDLEKYIRNKNINVEENLKYIKKFKNFTTYFSDFNTNRKNMYSDENKCTSIANRVIDENLPIFVNNMINFQKVRSYINIDKLSQELSLKYDKEVNIEEYFKLDAFNNLLRQDDINLYNNIINGFVKESEEKVQGLNEIVNLYNQTQKEKNNRLPKFIQLKKQILSDIQKRTLFEKIENDEQLLTEIKEYYNNYLSNLVFDDKNLIVELFKNINNYSLDKIYINNDNINEISNKIFHDWTVIQNSISSYYDEIHKNDKNYNTKKYIEEKAKLLKNQKMYSIGYIENCLSSNSNYKGKLVDYIISDLFSNFDDDNIAILYSNIFKTHIKRGELVKDIKEFLDVFKKLEAILNYFKPCILEIEKDDDFYSEFSELYECIYDIHTLYNQARNYLTKKPYSDDKIKINFNSETLLKGWDINKEDSSLGTIFIKDDNYYLGIINKNNKESKKIFKKYRDNNYKNNNSKEYYQKMEYKFLPGANKMFPKVFLSSKNKELYNPSNELMKNYKAGCYKKGDKFDKKFLAELIDFYKNSLLKNVEWKTYNMKFKDTCDYKDINEFYNDADEQGFKITFISIPSEDIDKLIDNNQLYLFQIYNKDFSKYSKGKKNLHTIYWQELFSQKNIENPVYRLNGSAEIFYRKASIDPNDMVIHKAGENIENKNNYVKENKKYSKFEYDIIKNKRYSENKLFFNVSITINCKCNNKENINKIVNKNIQENRDIYLLGIDRGERNLLYISLIDQNGNIIDQKSLNIVESNYKNNDNIIKVKTDYHNLLDESEKNRDNAKKSWQQINNIKEIKTGYLSQAINSIVQYIYKYNCIIVMENLNYNFKASRIKIDKQVYQKFENMLISKLNYLIKKDSDEDSIGGYLHGYQLTNKVDEKKNSFTQNGIILYIPPWATSKIDPVTGFYNIFGNLKYNNIQDTQKFISKFKYIKYNKENNYFEFSFDFKDFTQGFYGLKSDWIICTNSDRIHNYRDEKNNNQYVSEKVVLVDNFKQLFKEYNITFDDEKDMKSNILKQEDRKFYERFIYLLKLTLQLRNSSVDNKQDYIVSCVCNNNSFFDSRNNILNLPLDADANGAYNIARKGLMFVKQIKDFDSDDFKKLKLKITNDDWLKYVQGGNEK